MKCLKETCFKRKSSFALQNEKIICLEIPIIFETNFSNLVNKGIFSQILTDNSDQSEINRLLNQESQNGDGFLISESGKTPATASKIRKENLVILSFSSQFDSNDHI